MKCIDAAYRVLADAGEPLHYREITKRMLKRRLWRTSGQTPEETVNSRISKEINNLGTKPRFCHVGVGMYAKSSRAVRLLNTIQKGKCCLALEGTLVDWHSAGFRGGTLVHVRPDLACVIAGWADLTAEAKEQILRIVENGHRKS